MGRGEGREGWREGEVWKGWGRSRREDMKGRDDEQVGWG
jgi:hypothetical protein